MQLVQENSGELRPKIVEVVESSSVPVLSPAIRDVLGDLPLVKPEMVVLSKCELDLPDMTVEDKQLTSESDALVVVVTNALSQPQLLQEAFKVLKDKGYVISREEQGAKWEQRDDFSVLTVYSTGVETLVLVRKSVETRRFEAIKISNERYDEWLPKLQNAVKLNKPAILYAQKEATSGILGLFNCIRREMGGSNFKCLLIMDEDAPEFDSAT